MKILIRTQDSMLADILSLAVEGVLSAETVTADSDAEAAAAIGKQKDLDLLVLESDEADHPAIQEARKSKVPLLRITGPLGELKPGVSEREFVLTKPLDVKDFLELARFAVKGDPNSPKDDVYCRVKLDTLLMVGSQFEFDIFVRLSGTKYVKVVRRGDLFDSEKYSHFLNKGIRELFVQKEEFLQYLNSMAFCLENLAAGELALDESISATTNIYESIRSGLLQIGITPETQRVMKLTVDLAVRSIGKNPKLKELFAALTRNESSFQAWHSVALSFISCKLCSLMTWDSQNTHYKLALASMLHDIALKKPDWALFESEDDAAIAGLTEGEMREYLQHPLLAGDLVKQLDDFPGDVDYIISQHHELPDGTGFPRGINHTKISPLSALFIVAHDLCHRLHVAGTEFDFMEFLQDFDERYPLGCFRKIRTTLEEMPIAELTG